MNNIETHTSFELSKKLNEAGCGLISEFMYSRLHHFRDNKGDMHTTQLSDRFLTKDFFYSKSRGDYRAYDIMNDICIRYAKEFFGEEKIWDDDYQNSDIYPAYVYHSDYILHMLQQGKKKDAELYIWDNCLFNPANKPKKV